ncbi:transposase [uncultured Polaribacter sp.]|uniref:transposase n=1 Tax=uncultured Polaribacter sp. TaxID=174711 RepID=UPI002612B7F8|nr:transposase [uncultured Polaribacter sp.]
MNKKVYHITTAIHDSRTSSRMIKYQVRERREMGTNPYPNIFYFTEDEELLVTQIISKIVKEDNLQLLAYNICSDHIHLLLSCDIDEVSKIMQKIKGRTSFLLNKEKENQKHKGFKPLVEDKKKQKQKPIWQQKYSAPKEITSVKQLENTIKYIQTNRSKHQLPPHKDNLQNIIDGMCCSIDGIF